MKKLTTIILAGTALFLSMVIAAVEKAPGSGGRGSHQLVRFEPEDVLSIQIKKGADLVTIQQSNGLWFFTSPDPDRINTRSMISLLDQLNHLTIIDRFEKRELTKQNSLAELGLVSGTAFEITVHFQTSGKEKKTSFLIGNPSPRQNSVYAKVAGQKKEVAVVNGNPISILEAPYQNLRERRLVSAPSQGLVQIVVKTAHDQVAMQRSVSGQKTPWTLVSPVLAAADQNKVEDLIVSILSLQIEEADSSTSLPLKIPDPIPEGGALIQFGILGSQKPLLLYLETDPSQTDNFGPPLVQARISDRPANYRFRSSLLDSLPSSAGELRDRRLGNVPEKALQSIVILSRNNPEIILNGERNDQGIHWKVRNTNGKFVDANYSGIKGLIEQMNSPVIVDFVEGDKLEDYGLQPEAMRVGFTFSVPGAKNEDGTIGPDEKIDRVLRLGWKGEEAPRLFANFLGETEIFELDPRFASSIPRHPVKWRSNQVFSINPYYIKSIRRQIPGQEDITLEYDKIRDSWSGTRNDLDVSSNIDPIMATALRDRLASLRCHGWNLNVAVAYQHLKTPLAIFTIKTNELDPAVNEVREVTRVLTLARDLSTTEGTVFGQIEGNPDLFFLDNSLFRALLHRVTGSLLRETP